VGILVVYLVGKDPVQTKQAIWGCVVGSVLGIGTSVALQLTGVLTQMLGGLSR
jgi:sulfite exporter TauE/SafE